MFPRARLRRFNETCENTPGVGAYNVAAAKASDAERGRRIGKLSQSMIQLRHKALVAGGRGDLPKHVEDLHKRLQASEEKIIDLDILKISADKERELLQKEISGLQAQVSSLMKDCEAMVAARDQHKATSQALEEEKAQLLQCLDEKIPEFQSLVAQLRGQVDMYHEVSEQREGHVSDLQSRMADMEQRLTVLAQEKLVLCQELEESRLQIADLQLGNEGALAENERLVQEMASLKEGSEVLEKACRKDWEDKLKKLEKSQGEQLHICEQRIVSLNSERAMLEKRIGEILENEAASMMEMEQKESELMLKTQSLEEVMSQKAALENGFLILQHEKTQLEGKLLRTTEELMACKSQQKNQVQSLSEELKSQKKQLNTVISEVYSKTMAYEELRTQKTCLEEQLITVKDEQTSLRDELNRSEERFKLLQEEHAEKVKRMAEETDYQRSEYTAMLNEMSEKIQELEEQQADYSHASQEDDSENWKEKYEELEKRMEPFREVIDAFEVERKLIQDRDKYTQAQIEKLQQEAIKNMGHQNHKQKVKYVNTLKQENLALHQKSQALQEELVRQSAQVKKYKQKIDQLEGGGKTLTAKTPSKVKAPPKAPLREGNR